MKQNNKIIIVGAGIVGTTLAWYLSRHFKGQITLIDAHEAASGVTQHAFAWLNVSYGRPNEYSAFRKQALDEWRSLDKLTQGQLGINWSGAISWQHDREATQQFIDSHKKTGFNITALNKQQLQALEPNLFTLPELAAFSVDEGYVDPVYVTKTLLGLAINQGVNYLPNTAVRTLLQENDKIIGVTTSTSRLYAGQVIITAGLGAIELLQPLHVTLPIAPSPSIIAHFQDVNATPAMRHILSTPDMEVRPTTNGNTLCAEDYIDEQPQHSAGNIAQNALSVIQNSFIGTDTLVLQKAFVGMRPMPQDELPIVGKVADFSGLYIISMHAAITLAPLICHLAQDEIIHGIEKTALSPYRLTRFASGN
ncbi:FAD-binding oxidoreductase [Providencia stuartii]|uniref:NAD(P)/FAD-dependent oxidoreductase n=1 Tax=Providencia stuartii TaxID=588 RepID=UPI001FF58E66|nr:FAD-dependent oxidoreductase [Providencia stuartii]ELZ5939209.1 FAD-binding oxidoreductase [Providencia stuartii]MCK1145005.1 FAD-binding oxidoreductase [Providencia stuartii]